MMEEQKDTSPFVKSRRIKRLVSIREVNTPPSTVFDVTVEYPSDALPEWFAPLQTIVEDETFTSIDINLGSGKVRYLITIAGNVLTQESKTIRQGECAECGRVSSLLSANGYCEGCVMQAAIDAQERE